MKTLLQLATERGLTIVDRGNGHIQILGGTCLVNYWPESKRRSAHIAGHESRGKRHVTPEQAIEMAFQPDPRGPARMMLIKQDEPKKRSISDWLSLLPHLRFAWSKRKRQ